MPWFFCDGCGDSIKKPKVSRRPASRSSVFAKHLGGRWRRLPVDGCRRRRKQFLTEDLSYAGYLDVVDTLCGGFAL